MQIFRCALRESPSSVIGNDCIIALVEGLCSSFNIHLVGLLGKDDDPTHSLEVEPIVESERNSLCHVILQICRKKNYVLSPQPFHH